MSNKELAKVSAAQQPLPRIDAVRVATRISLHHGGSGLGIQPWRQLVSVTASGSSKAILCSVDDPLALSQALAERVQQKIFGVLVASTVQSSRSRSRGQGQDHNTDAATGIQYHYGQAGIVRYPQHVQTTPSLLPPLSRPMSSHRASGASQRSVPATFSSSSRSASPPPFVGRVVTSSRNLPLQRRRRSAQAAVLIRPGSCHLYLFPGLTLPLPSTTTTTTTTTTRSTRQATGLWARRRGPSRTKKFCSQAGVAFSACKVFNGVAVQAADSSLAFRPFVPVRGDFRYEVGQCVGMAVYHSASQDAARRFLSTCMGEHWSTENDTSLATSSRSGSLASQGDTVGKPTRERIRSEAVHIYTGRITFVGEHHIEYDINTCGGCVGAIVFLLDQRQPRVTVKAHDYGRAIAVHTGSSIWANCGVKLHL
jgi:hypothetical protein